ncbi:hypothetical protein APHAL10511_004208 [Amanita phalloides]|nr:hypothetical protein APHAL10511_004208 [Amanita phalloides]
MSLEAREPGLIPLLTPPLPIVRPALDPLMGPNPLPPSPRPVSGGGGGGNGGGGGGNSGEDGGSNGNKGGGRGDGNGGSDGGDGAGTGNGGGNGNGGNSGNGGGDDNGGRVGASKPGDGGGANDNPTSTPAQAAPVGGTSVAGLTNGTTRTSDSPLGTATVGAHLTHTVSSATSFGYIAVTTGSSSTALPSSSQSQSGIINNMDNGGGDDSGSNTGSTSSSTGALSQNHGLSSGGIAGIVTFLLLVGLAGLVLVLRRHAITRRAARRQWFDRGGLGAGLYADYDSHSNTSAAKLGGRSARSSFATTFDQSHSLKLGLDFDAFLPPIPPMAEIRGEGPLIVSAALSNLAPKNQRRSTGSNNSNSSDPNARDLLLSAGIQSNEVIGAPMTVRPFSPSESYSFPRPPPSREVSSLLYKDGNSHSEGADEVWSFINASRKSPTAAAAADPFADPDPAATALQPDFADIEMIQRPFVPTLSDELVAAVGDYVRIMQTFDDGWAFVQKLPPANDQKGKAKAVDEFGLIPIDCLRIANQEFLVQKRASSYVEDAEVISCSA